MKSLMAHLRNTVENRALIQDGDRVAVGLSGGKDSMVLLHSLARLKSFNIIQFDLCAITVNPGFDGFNSHPLKAFCDTLNVPFYEEKTDIFEIVFHIRHEKNPCSLCAKMRRGALVEAIQREGYTTLALGHHNDDALTTFLMNFTQTGRLKTLPYNTKLDKSGIHVIRPLLDVTENQIIGYSNKQAVPVEKSKCPVDKTTNRAQMNDLLQTLFKSAPRARASMNRALQNEEQLDLWFD